MTNSAKSMALICICAFIAASINRYPTMAIFSLALLAWMAVAYFIFRIQCLRLTTRLSVKREIQENASPTAYLWANRNYPVRLTLHSPVGIPAGTQVRDVLPELLASSDATSHRPVDGFQAPHSRAQRTVPLADIAQQNRSLAKRISNLTRLSHWLTPASSESGAVASHAPVENPKVDTPPVRPGHANSLISDSNSRTLLLHYSLRPLAAGVAVIPGVRLAFTDYFNWFRRDLLIPCQQTITALPPYHKSGEVRSILKNANAIPQHGIHRQRRPGMGFELLELREYQDGDPPKSIAWKASARRENLMTRQYETEVPVRVQLIVEGRLSSRVGSFGLRTLDQINQVATSVAYIATQNGDHVGAYLIDDQKTETVSTASGSKGFHQIAHALARFSSGRYPRHVRWTEELQNAAYAVASEYYPRLLENRFNPTGYNLWDRLSSVTRRRHVQLANLIAAQRGYNALQHVELLHDVHVLASRLQRFLCDHGAPWQAPLLAQQELLRSTRPSDWHPMVAAIQRTVAHAKDNEVIVIFADLLSADRRHEPLLEACKLARGRKHRVAIVSTSPSWERPTPASSQNSSFTGNLRESAEELRSYAESLRLRDETFGTIRKFREQGIPCSVASTLETVPWVLSEVELARSGRFTKTGAAR